MQVGAISRVLSTSSFAAALFAGAALSSGAVATFQNGLPSPFDSNVTYTGTDETYIRGGGQEHDNYGAAYGVFTASGYQGYALIRFDLSSLAGKYSSIDSVTLTFVTDNPVTNVPFTLNAINAANADWVEGTGNESGITPGDGIPNAATFAKKLDKNGVGDVDWDGGPGLGVGTATPGYNTTPAASGTWDTGGNTNADITVTLSASLIQSWATNPSANGGLILLDNTGSASYALLVLKGSDANGTISPKLVVNYTPVPEPAALSLLGLGALAMPRRRK